MTPSTMGLRVVQSCRPGSASVLPKDASLPGFLPLPLLWAQLEADLRSFTGHSWNETWGLER